MQCENVIPKDEQDQAPVYGDQESKCCVDVSELGECHIPFLFAFKISPAK